MNKKITEIDVARAIHRLKARGMKPTLNSIRAELGNQGSKTTIVRMVKSLNARNETANLSNNFSEDINSIFIKDRSSGDEPSEILQKLYSISSVGEARGIVTQLCLTIQSLKTELAICQSNNEALRSSQKQALEALRASIKL